MASLEAEIKQYTTEIEKKDARIDDLWTQKRQLKDADEKKEYEQRIQALQDDKAELVKLRSKLQDKLPGAYGRHPHSHSRPTTTPVASCVYPGSLLSLHGELQLLRSQHGEP